MLKLTIFFHQGTLDSAGNPNRLAGWTETWFKNSSRNEDFYIIQRDNLLDVRAKLLAKNCSIVGFREQEFDPVTDIVGMARTYVATRPGGAATDQDLFDMALMWRVRSQSTPNARNVILRGVPDARVVTGEFSPASVAYNNSIHEFFRALIGSQWLMRGADRTQEGYPIKSINVDGVTILKRDSTLVVGNRVKLLRCCDINGVYTTGEYDLAVVGGARNMTLANFQTKGAFPLVHGRIRKVVPTQFVPVEITEDEEQSPLAITREAGRPFHSPRGRQ